MKFKALIFYSKLALSEEENNFVAEFLREGCKIIEEEINQKANNKYSFEIDFLYLEKGEQGVINLIKKIKSYSDIFITHGHVVAKHNNTIIDENPSKEFFFFHTSPKTEDEYKNNSNIFYTGRTDRSLRIKFIQDEIQNIKNNRIYFFHNEVRISEQVISNNKENENFSEFSFKEQETDEIKKNIENIFTKLDNEDLIILDVGLKCFREVFNFLENNNFSNKVICNFGSLDNRFKKLSFNLIDLSAQHITPSLSLKDIINKIYSEEITPNRTNLLLDSAYRLEYPLLFSEALEKCDIKDIQERNINKIRSALLSFNGTSDIFVGKRLQYAFNSNRSNTLKDNFHYIYPNSLQIRENDTPKIMYYKQYVKYKNEVKVKNVIYSYIDILRVTNIDIKARFWTAEFYLDMISNFEEPIEEVIFNNLSTLNDKFTHKDIWIREEENGYSTKRYYVVANFDFLPVADNYPFDWQNIYIAMTIKNGDKQILQPVPLHLVDQDFDISEWHIQNSFTGIKYQKNKLYQDTDLKKTVSISSENRVGWILRRKNTATLFKVGIPMSFLIFLVYYSIFLSYEEANNSIGILTTTFLSAIALYFSVEKPEPKRMTIIDLVFVWFYIVNGVTVVAFGMSSFLSEQIFNFSTSILKFIVPVSLVSIGFYLWKRVRRNREDILLDRDI